MRADKDDNRAYHRAYYHRTKAARGSPEAIALAEKRRSRRLANYDRVREQEKRSRDKNRSKHNEKCREYQRTARAVRPSHMAAIARKSRYKSKYGITMEEWNKIFDMQDKACAICQITDTTKWTVDHCHTSNKVRGILCHYCNIMLGHAKDNPVTLERGAKYLRLNP